MRVAVCHNLTPPELPRGEERDRLADAGVSEAAQAVHAALCALGHEAAIVPLGRNLDRFLEELRTFRPDVIFNLCEAFWGDSRREMHVAALFDLLGVPYTGSDALCLGLTQDKFRTKALLVQAGLPTPPFFLVQEGEKYPPIEKFRFPMFVKPPYEDGSQGISADSVVRNRKELMARVAYIHATYRQPALVEEFIDGRELNVAILGFRKTSMLPISEIIFPPGMNHRIVCFESKWQEESDLYHQVRGVCPAELGAREQLVINVAALRAYKLLGCRDYARIDIRLRNQTPYILEVNANPDLSPGAGLARAAKAEGRSYQKLVARILDCALQRKGDSSCVL
ncbi:MAG: ATP-grasp domain-containing protein [Geothermobacteraceae bacterium]